MEELIAHLSEKSYAYGAIRAENQNLLFTISKLKTRLANVEKGMNVTSSVRRPVNRDSHVKNSVLANSKKPAKKVAVYVRKNKQTDNISKNVISNKENVFDVDVANASKAKTLLCVSYHSVGLNDSGCSKHMTGDRSLLKNFIEKFMGTVHFGNDNFAAIIGYAEIINTPSKEDLDNLFGPMYKEYFEKKFSDTPINSAAQPTQIHEDSPFKSSIIVDEHEAPPIVTTSDEQTSPISLTEADEFNQEDSADFDGNSQFVPYNPPSHEEIESSTMALEPSNVQNFHQVQPSTHIWIKDHPLDQVIGDPSKPVMTRKQLYTDSEDWIIVIMSNILATERLDADLQGTPADQMTYRRMIGGLSYNMGLWYPKDFGFELIAYLDVNHAGCKDDGKITSGGLQFLVIIMAQQQHAADVHSDELCPPNKRYDLIDANKKVDLEHMQCPPKSKILTNIIKNHPLRFSIAACSSVPWIHMAQEIQRQSRNANPEWMISEEMKNTKHFRMYAEVFGLDVPLTQSQLTESTQGTHRTPSAPRRSTCLTPPAPVPTVDKVDEMILQDTLQELPGRYTYLFEHLKARFLSRKSFDTLADHLQEVMVKSLPIMVDTHIKEQVKKQVPEQVRDQVLVYVAEGLILERHKTKEEMERMIAKAILQVPQTTCRPSAVRPRDSARIPHDDAHPEGENRAKRQKTSEYEAYVSGESSSR
ncbi:hypothetical protein Tco_1192462 [Tanacetum coccineum]